MSAVKVSRITNESFDMALRELLTRGGYEQTLREFMAKNPTDREIRQQLTLAIGRRADSTHGIIALHINPKIALYWGSYGGNGIKPTLEGAALVAKIREIFRAEPASGETEQAEVESKPRKSSRGRWDGSKKALGDPHKRSYYDLSLIELEDARGRDLAKLPFEKRQHYARLRDEYNRRFGLSPNENGVYVGCEGIEHLEYQHRTGAEIKIALLESPFGWLVSMAVGVKGTGTGCFGSSEPLQAVDVYEAREAALRSRLERVPAHCERNQSDGKKVAEAKNLMRKWAKAQLDKLEENAPLAAITEAVEHAQSLTLQPSLFDYSTLDPETQSVVRHAASEIKRLYRMTVDCAIEIGSHLLDVKNRLYGRYGEWLKAEFDMSERSARDFEYMAQQFGDVELPETLPLTVVRILAQPSTPRAAREEVIKRAEEGEKVTVEETKQTVTKHIQKKWTQASILEEPGVIEQESAIIAETEAESGVCRICGCTDENPCLDSLEEPACEWTDETTTLCSKCKTVAENPASTETPKSATPVESDKPTREDAKIRDSETPRGIRIGNLFVVENHWNEAWHIQDADGRSIKGSQTFYHSLQKAIDDAMSLQVEEVIEVIPDPATNPRKWLKEEWTRSRLILTIIVEPESKGNRRVNIKASLTGKSAEKTAKLEEMINFERGPVASVLNSLRKQSRKARTTATKKAKGRKARA